jgi:hypothetical protein
MRYINLMNDSETLTATDLSTLKLRWNSFIFDVLGLKKVVDGSSNKLEGL